MKIGIRRAVTPRCQRLFWCACAVVSLVGGGILRAEEPQSIAKLVQALDSPDEAARLAAIDSLGQRGAAAKDAVPQLAKKLTDSSPKIRGHAVWALQMIGPAAGGALPALIKVLEDRDPHVRRMAETALPVVGGQSEAVVLALAKSLDDSDPAVCIAALNGLTELGEVSVPALVKSLERPKLRYWATLALGELGPAAKKAVGALGGAVDDENSDERREALLALAKIGPDAAAAVPKIVPHLADADPSVRNAAALALGRIGPAAVPAAGALRKAIESQDELLKAVSTWALRIEPKNEDVHKQAIELLTAMLSHANPRAQIAAVKGLIDLESHSPNLIPLLADVITKGTPPLVDEALAALGAQGEAATPALIAALKRPEARGRAAIMLAKLGAKAHAAVPALTEALGDNDPEIRREVLLALATIGPEAVPAQNAIVSALNDPETRVRAVAAYALGRIGPAAANAVPQLRGQLESSDPVVRVASAYALVHIAPGNDQTARQALPQLIQGLENPNVAVRRGSAEALGLLGKKALEAEKPLRAAAHDPDSSVRKAAVAALERMGIVVDTPPRKVPTR